MFSPLIVILLLIVSAVILTYAILFYRQQKKLSEKKARLLMSRKEAERLIQRNEIVRADLARAKPEYKKHDWEHKLLRMELREAREDIRDSIAVIRKEGGGSEGGTGRILTRRKELLKSKLEEYKNQKTICLERRQVVLAAERAVKSLEVEEDENDMRLEGIIEDIKALEVEFNAISNSPLIKLPFGRRRDNQRP